jgi:methylmalonyl-CoA mutase N-terminal domain/subunit
VEQVKRLRARRDGAAVRTTLGALQDAARDPGTNLMPLLLDAARADATEGEMVETLQKVFGTYTESPAF